MLTVLLLLHKSRLRWLGRLKVFQSLKHHLNFSPCHGLTDRPGSDVVLDELPQIVINEKFRCHTNTLAQEFRCENAVYVIKPSVQHVNPIVECLDQNRIAL